MGLEVVAHVPRTPTYQTPLLFLHGAWHGAWCWEDNFLPYFAAKGYPAYAMSLRGHGASRGKLRGSSVGDYVTDLVDVVKSLPQPPVIVAHALGAFVAQKYLEHYHAPGVVLVSPVSVRSSWNFTLRLLRRIPLATLYSFVTFSLYPVINSPERAHTTFFSESAPRADVERYFKLMTDEFSRAFLDLLFLAPDAQRIRERGAPLLIIGGERDCIVQPGEVARLAEQYGAPVTLLPDTAHDVMLEARWQAAADRICEWLAERGIP